MSKESITIIHDYTPIISIVADREVLEQLELHDLCADNYAEYSWEEESENE